MTWLQIAVKSAVFCNTASDCTELPHSPRRYRRRLQLASASCGQVVLAGISKSVVVILLLVTLFANVQWSPGLSEWSLTSSALLPCKCHLLHAVCMALQGMCTCINMCVAPRVTALPGTANCNNHCLCHWHCLSGGHHERCSFLHFIIPCRLTELLDGARRSTAFMTSCIHVMLVANADSLLQIVQGITGRPLEGACTNAT